MGSSKCAYLGFLLLLSLMLSASSRVLLMDSNDQDKHEATTIITTVGPDGYGEGHGSGFSGVGSPSCEEGGYGCNPDEPCPPPIEPPPVEPCPVQPPIVFPPYEPCPPPIVPPPVEPCPPPDYEDPCPPYWTEPCPSPSVEPSCPPDEIGCELVPHIGADPYHGHESTENVGVGEPIPDEINH